MLNVRKLVQAQLNRPVDLGLRALAAEVGMTRDVSLLAVVSALQQPVVLHAPITTAGLSGLGGTADLTLARDGRFTFDVHLHNSGLDPYDVKVRVAVRAPNGITVVFQCSGHTDGTGSDVFGADLHRNFDHHEEGTSGIALLYWMDLRRAVVDVSKSYEDSGLLAAAEDVLKALVGFLIADVTLGAGLALVVTCSAELSDAFDGNIAGPGGLVGVVVAGGIAWVWGPSAILASVAAGFTAGAITDALVQHRTLTSDEYAFAQVVFGDTLPPRDRIYVTNLSRDPGRSYTWPNVDQSVLLNINQAYADPVDYFDDDYPKRGQLLVHELTHAWQIQTEDFIPGLVCERVTRTSTYTTDSSLGWDDLGLEQQAASVDSWFADFCDAAPLAKNQPPRPWTTLAELASNLSEPMATEDARFRYVSDHLRLGTN